MAGQHHVDIEEVGGPDDGRRRRGGVAGHRARLNGPTRNAARKPANGGNRLDVRDGGPGDDPGDRPHRSQAGEHQADRHHHPRAAVEDQVDRERAEPAKPLQQAAICGHQHPDERAEGDDGDDAEIRQLQKPGQRGPAQPYRQRG